MITKSKRKSRLIKKFTKGAIRLSTANGTNVRKNKMCHYYGFYHHVYKNSFLQELGIDVMQFISNKSRMDRMKRRQEAVEQYITRKLYKLTDGKSERLKYKQYLKKKAEILKNMDLER